MYNLQLEAAKWMVLCYFDADSERYQVPSLGKGTVGISGGDGLGKKGTCVGILGLLNCFFKSC